MSKHEIIKTAYQSRIEEHNQELVSLKQQANTWSIIRFVSFLVFASIFIVTLEYNLWFAFGLLYLLIFAFVKIVKYHQKISNQKKHKEEIIIINQKEIEYLSDHSTDRNEGNIYKDPLHPYSSDLDLFGDQSFFQFLERANTKVGRDKIAKYLREPLDIDTIKLNQDAVKELAEKIQWRQRFGAHKLKVDDQKLNIDLLGTWGEHSDQWAVSKMIKILSFIMPIITTALAIYLAKTFGILAGLLGIIPNYLLLRHYGEKIAKTQDLLKHTFRYISKYDRYISEIENADFQSQKMQAIQAIFLKDGGVSKQLGKLDWYLDQLDLKLNFLGILFSQVTLWDFHFMRLVANWKTNHLGQVEEWVDQLAETEFLCSLGNLAYNNPEWITPKIGTEQIIHASEMGHPLIDPNKRINNDIDLPTLSHIKLITGSNMGGKSTFQRTVGLNLVLAYMGSNVCASKFNVPLLSLITSMRTSDALKESTSGFYAELKRLKLILDSVKGGTGYYFMIDEVLKGTNTNDRHKGSVALIKQLIDHGGAGLVSTHDLELANLESELGKEKLENKCFEVEVKENELIFDYKIKDGVSQSFNATQLMRNMGIDL